ncbi:hypothetical protein D1007_62298 [Hordeum vulgare]|nr:hypothetical protein D1007_62298 [Hordeum vulgare]
MRSGFGSRLLYQFSTWLARFGAVGNWKHMHILPHSALHPRLINFLSQIGWCQHAGRLNTWLQSAWPQTCSLCTAKWSCKFKVWALLSHLTSLCVTSVVIYKLLTVCMIDIYSMIQ